MKVKDVNNTIDHLLELATNLEKLRAFSEGCTASMPGPEKGREWSENIADKANLSMSLPNIFSRTKEIVQKEADRLKKVVEEADVDV